MRPARVLLTAAVCIAVGAGTLAPLGAATAAPGAATAETQAAPTVGSDSLDVVGWDDLAVGTARPRFSWVVEDADRDEHQSAYELEVTGPEGEVWDSGKITSTASTLRQYDGPDLASGTTYDWRVKVWDAAGLESAWSDAATLRTGLLDLADWQADWITVPGRQQARSEFTLGQPLADGDQAILYLAAQGNALARLNGQRVSDEELGTTWTDWDQRVLYRSVDVTELLVDGDNAIGVTVAATHTVKVPDITVMAQVEVVAADGTREVVATTDDGWRAAPGGLTRVDAYRGERYDARLATPGWDTAGFDDAGWTPVPVVAPVAGAPNLSTGADVTALDTIDCCGWGRSSINDGVLVSTDSSQGYHSATTDTPDAIKWVQLDLGSSRPIGTITLWPAMPTNDPAGSVPGTGFPVRYRVEASNDPSFATSVVIADRTGADQPNPGASAVTETSTATGRYVRVTATKLPPSSGSYSFRLAELVVRGTDADRGWGLSPLEADITPPMRVIDTIDPLSVTTVAPGVQRYDFGTNYAGWARLTATAPAGTTAQVHLGEILDGNGRVTTDNQNFAPGEEQRQTYRYTFAGGGQPETWEPSFAYSGFRYAEVSGLPAGTTVTLQARPVHTDLQRESSLDTGNPVLAGIEGAASQGQLIAMHGVPEDTPTREKKGWLGDAISTAGPIMDTFDGDDIFRKYLGDIQTSIFDVDGGVPSVAPSRQSGREYKVDPSWAAGYPVILWEHFRREGDASLLEQHYDDLAGYVDYLDTIDDADRIVVNPEVSYGQDWQAVESTNPRMFHTLHYRETVQILADMARVLDRSGDATTYDALADEIAAGFNRRFLDRGAASYGGTQLANAFPLLAGVVPEPLEERVLDRLVANVRDRGDHLTGGFVGTRVIIKALHAFDRDDVVLDTAVRTDYPSLGFMVKQGPGTIWEKWVESSAPDGTSSRSHPALAGGMQEWFYNGLAGITALEPGYRSISLTVPDLGEHSPGSASAGIESPLGRVSSSWTRDGADLAYAVEVPVGATAEVSVPAASRYAVTEGGQALTDAAGVHDVEAGGDRVVVTVGSGSYDFAVTASGQRLGAILDDIDDLSARVDALADDADLSAADASTLRDGLAQGHADVAAALDSLLTGDDAASATHLQDALAEVRALRSWLAPSAVDAPVRGPLDRRLAALESSVSVAVAHALGVSVALPQVPVPALPGSTVTGTLDIVNAGDAALTGVAGTVTVDGWKPATVATAAVAAGATVQLPVSFEVPAGQRPGPVDALLDLRFTRAGAEHDLASSTIGWASVASGITLGVPTATAPGDPAERMTLAVPVANAGTLEVRAHVAVVGGVPSPEVVVPPGGTVTAQVPAAVPLSRVGGATRVSLVARTHGVELATRTADVVLDLATPPQGASDHVDLGDAASENAHALQASAASGTNSEAGLTRRYTTTTAGQWFSVEVAVPAGTPFLLRATETFDGARAKRYDVSVDGTVVQETSYSRTATGPGTMTHDLLVTDPAVLDHDGTVRVRYEYPTGAGGAFDASIADLWVLPLPDDSTAPEVGAEVVAGTPGTAGWYRSDVSVAVRAADARAGATVVETGTTSGWQPYAGPVAVTDEGRHEVAYRATDAAGNTSPEQSLLVRIDSVPPSTILDLEKRRGARAELRLTATDATSGVASTSYRLDGGPWTRADADAVQVSGAGEHVVEYVSTDLAGNVEPLRRTTIDLVDHEPPAPPVPDPGTGTSTPPPTPTPTPDTGVVRATSSVRAHLAKKKVRAGTRVAVTAKVTARDITPTGKVRIVVDGKVARTVRLVRGKTRTSIKVTRGKHRVVVRYLGSRSVARSASSKQIVRGV